MLKFSSVSILLYSFIFSFMKQTEQYSPFMVVIPEEKIGVMWPHFYKLPSKFADSTEEGKELILTTKYIENPIEIPLCPEVRSGNENSARALETLNDDIPATKGCLLVTSFKEDEEPVCEKEPQPWFGNQRDGESNLALCGTNKHQRLINSEYYNCGTEAFLKNYKLKAMAAEMNNGLQVPFIPEHYRMYEICFDFKQEKTLWARHEVLTPELLSHKKYPYKSLNTFELDEFSIETYRLQINNKVFANIKASYESADANMKIYPLVPKTHMALPYWKKSTTHIINSAPLLPKFFPLMEAINNGIFIASTYIFMKLNSNLKIYTKADTNISKWYPFAKALQMDQLVKLEHPIELFGPSKWYVFVYNEPDTSGILIILHNTSGAPPTNKECGKDEFLTCSFAKWSMDSVLISSNSLEYAYCCQISKKKIKELFEIDFLPDLSPFDIQQTIDLAKNELFGAEVNEDTGSSKGK